ncbi:MAG: polysaccharide pyruvyl transferase family protein [Bacteroidetes bacterium]|uniref:Polysaccharide pyruvyl transferase family protein n=1 Tax=Candidatus Pullibacteroides excrementavium TaxID=2840905 RepID=A0A9D9DR78_9BACT|nr:polysaccharide pyruvyl transferase family protein [Candidatus Pullibacteroides excrementavium]
MKIKIITCHDVYNYGASLQAYALQTYLIAEGYDVEIIDYKPDYMRVHYKFWYVPRGSRYYTLAKKNIFFRFLLCCYFAPKRFATYGRKRKFDTFTRQYLHLTRRYNSYQELVSDPPAADVYIAGSDQIWNCALPNGKDPAYFLQFGDEDVRRISYAASFAIPEVPKEYHSQIQTWLSGFSAISVRELTGVSILKGLGFCGTSVLDPVFLLPVDTWLSFISRKKNMGQAKYVLVYDLSLSDSRLQAESHRLAAQHGLQIVSIDAARKCPYAQKNLKDADPFDFVRCIYDAEFVVTDSFHATALSLIFNKKFSVFYGQKNISRLQDILHYLGVGDQLNSKNPVYEIDWGKVNSKLSEFRLHSMDFLTKNLY